MPDGNGRLPTIGIVTTPLEARGELVAAVVDHLAGQGWTAHVLSGKRRNGASIRSGSAPQLLHLASAALAHDWMGVARAVQARTVVSLHGDDVTATTVALPRRLPLAWAGADALHVESEGLAALVHEQRDGARIVSVIPPLADPVLLGGGGATRAARAPLRLLSVGALSWTSGYEFGLAGVKLLVDRGIACEYRIVGHGAHQDAVAFARHQLGLDACVELVDPSSPPELREHLRWADVLVDTAVLPSSQSTILDAQAAGVPIVTSQPPEGAVTTVLPVAPRDPQALGDALARLTSDQDLRDRLVAAGRERARQAPTIATQAARFQDLYREVLAVDEGVALDVYARP